MSLADTLRLAFNNLRQAKLRTGLTSLGVAIGIAALIGMVSLGVGLQDQLLGRFMASGVFDAITVTGGGNNNLPAFLGGTAGRRGGRGGRAGRSGGGPSLNATTPAPPEPPALDDAALATLAALPNVKQVVPAIRVPLLMKMGDFQEGGTAVGIPLSAKDEGAFRTMTAGAFFANEIDDACLLSLDVAKRIAPDNPTSLVGQTLLLSYTASSRSGGPSVPPTAPDSRSGGPSGPPGAPDSRSGGPSGPPTVPDGRSGGPLGPPAGPPAALMQLRRIDRPYRIAGIVEREPGPNVGSFGFASVMIPLPKAIDIDAQVVRSAQQLLADASAPKKRTYASVTVKVTRAQHTQDVEEQIKTLGYTAFSLNDALQGAKRAFILIDILLSLIGSIALAVSSLGIVNTMVMSILERTREIGVMKAIGASDRAIRRIFLVEASAIGLIGGVAGVVLGWVVARVVNYGANIYIVREGGEAGNLFAFPLWLVGSALAFSWLISLIAGSYPARRAARLNPIQALRHD